ncbi:MAG: T9SS type A sorting domain-containing protein [Flavobacteriia bacterium]|nr:T9SS type A sorting domain-containing protein [Flavobacteriia bacterium]
MKKNILFIALFCLVSLSLYAGGGSAPANNDCSGATAFPVIPTNGTCSSLSNQSTANATASNVTPSGSCTSNYGTPDDDIWFKFQATATTILLSATNDSGDYDIVWQVFSGSCGGTMTSIFCDDYSDSGFSLTGLTIGNWYYIKMYTYYSGATTQYDICMKTPPPPPANDNCSGAISTIVNGVGSCASQTAGTVAGATASGIALGSCYGTADDDVWFSFVAGSTSQIIALNSISGSTSDMYFSVYSGTCASLGAAILCSDAESNTVNNLTPGNTYYVRVYTYTSSSNQTSTFNICVQNPPPPVLAQDCDFLQPICNSVVNVPSSYVNTGSIIDFVGTNDCTSGEKNSVWYSFEVGTSGSLNFSIKPNDAVNSDSGAETDYDWVLWKATTSTGTVVNTCQTLDNAPPVSCNYGYVGITGISPGGTTPAPFTGANDAYFEPTVSVTAGEKYILVVQNFETTASGFNLDFSTSTPGVIDNTPNTLYWKGTTNTNFTTSTNYLTCSGQVPSCGVSVVVNSAANQPILTTSTGASGVHTVNNLTINAGATFTISAGATLEICGNFINNGTLVCSPTSTVKFVGSGTAAQNITGNFVGGNKLGHVVILKTAGSVLLNNNLTMGGNFTTSNLTSVFNSNNKYIKLAGDFDNFSGNTTFTNTGTLGTLEFIGTGLQKYNQGASQLDLNFVIVNNTAGVSAGVTLLSNMNIKATTGTLTLTAGTITTGGTLNTGGSATITGGYRVIVNNITASSVTDGNNTSFINGTLRRYCNDPGNYSWPVGNAAKGYQLAKTNFTAMNNSMHYIDCRFDPWLITYTIGTAECGKLYSLESMNNGMWTFIPDGGTCTYDCTLYPNNVTNILGSAYTIIKRPHTSAISTTGWILNGTCATSTSTAVTRTGMTDFSFFGVDQGIVSTPIELIYFEGKNEGKVNVLQWETSSERENDYFELQRSTDGNNFDKLTTIDGAGNSVSSNYYNYTDSEPSNGYNYYRFKQVDYNGSETFSDIVLIKNNTKEFAISNLYPNPSNNSSNCAFYSPKTGELSIKIIDNSGRVIENTLISIKSESNNGIQINSEQFENGIYSVEFNFNNGEYKTLQKLVKN